MQEVHDGPETRIEVLTRALENRTADLHEALKQQAATAKVFNAISGSAFDLDAVLTTLIRTAIDLCEATRGVVWLLERGQLHLAAHVNYPEEWVGSRRQWRSHRRRMP